MYFFNLFCLVVLILINLMSFGYSHLYEKNYFENDYNEASKDEYNYDEYNTYQDIYEEFGIDKMFPSLPIDNLNVAIKGKPVIPGQYVDIFDLLDIPLVSWDCGLCGPGEEFILMMFDGKEVGTFGGQKFVHLFVPTKACSTAQVLLPKLGYIRPSPPPATGVHPYIFALYCSNNSNKLEKLLSRALFFPNKENMPSPKAVNFIRSGAPVVGNLDLLPGNINLPGGAEVAPLSSQAVYIAKL